MEVKTSPFKFLDPFSKNDKHIFFGREKESSDLYKLVLSSSLVMLYGTTGTGKTSLIQCGLGNKFESNDWLPLFIRFNDGLVESMDNAIQDAALSYIPIAEIDDSGDEHHVPFPQKLKRLYLDHYKPVYLIFDQFEEIFTLGTPEQQQDFINHLKVILDSDVQCTVILSMREEFIARLTSFEETIPQLFENRYRLERMSPKNLKTVIRKTTLVAGIKIENEEENIGIMLENMKNSEGQVDLTDLQIYLDTLFKEATNNGHPDKFTKHDILSIGMLQRILALYLKDSIDKIETGLNEQGFKENGLPMEILFELVTNDMTKRPAKVQQVASMVWESYPELTDKLFDFCLDELKKFRIIREID